MNIIENLNWRYATKEFDPQRDMPSKDLDTLLEVLRLSPSSFGLQPWKFVLVKDQAKKEELLPFSWNQKQVVDASELIVLCCQVNFGEADVNRFLESIALQRKMELKDLSGYKDMILGFMKEMSAPELKNWMKAQVYIALGNLLTACADLKIDACPMEGFNKANYDKILNLTEHGLESVVVCPVGYRSSSDKYAILPKVRYPVDEVVLKI